MKNMKSSFIRGKVSEKVYMQTVLNLNNNQNSKLRCSFKNIHWEIFIEHLLYAQPLSQTLEIHELYQILFLFSLCRWTITTGNILTYFYFAACFLSQKKCCVNCFFCLYRDSQAFHAHTQSYLTLCDPMDCSPAGSSVHGILQARILEWAVFPSSRWIY